MVYSNIVVTNRQIASKADSDNVKGLKIKLITCISTKSMVQFGRGLEAFQVLGPRLVAAQLLACSWVVRKWLNAKDTCCFTTDPSF